MSELLTEKSIVLERYFLCDFLPQNKLEFLNPKMRNCVVAKITGDIQYFLKGRLSDPRYGGAIFTELMKFPGVHDRGMTPFYLWVDEYGVEQFVVPESTAYSKAELLVAMDRACIINIAVIKEAPLSKGESCN